MNRFRPRTDLPDARRRALRGLVALGAATLAPWAARAQAPAAFPARPVRILVPQAPGGASDALARVMAARLGERWGQNVIVENRAGAGGNVGTEAVAKSPPDGYTLLMGYAGTNSINPALYARPGWSPQDFVPVATLAAVPFAGDRNFKTPSPRPGASCRSNAGRLHDTKSALRTRRAESPRSLRTFTA